MNRLARLGGEQGSAQICMHNDAAGVDDAAQGWSREGAQLGGRGPDDFLVGWGGAQLA
jgi:hypothetical protein